MPLPTSPLRLVLLLGPLLLAGCADSFSVRTPDRQVGIVGRIEAAAAIPGVGCDAMDVELKLEEVGYHGGTDPVARFTGRAFRPRRVDPVSRGVAALQPYHLEGDLYSNGTVLLEMTRATYFAAGSANALGARPFSVFRGAMQGNRMELIEQVPSCNRRLSANGFGPRGATGGFTPPT